MKHYCHFAATLLQRLPPSRREIWGAAPSPWTPAPQLCMSRLGVCLDVVDIFTPDPPTPQWWIRPQTFQPRWKYPTQPGFEPSTSEFRARHSPKITRIWTNAGLLLVQCLRRWPNSISGLVRCVYREVAAWIHDVWVPSPGSISTHHPKQLLMNYYASVNTPRNWCATVALMKFPMVDNQWGNWIECGLIHNAGGVRVLQ